MPDRTQTVDQLIRRRAASDRAKAAVIDPVSAITYGELDVATRDLAASFVDAGINKGTRVGLIMPNSVRWVAIAVALTRIGAVLVPLSTLLQPRELVSQLREASVQILIGVEEFRGHRYLDGLPEWPGPELPALHRVWPAGRLPATASDAASGIV